MIQTCPSHNKKRETKPCLLVVQFITCWSHFPLFTVHGVMVALCVAACILLEGVFGMGFGGEKLPRWCPAADWLLHCMIVMLDLVFELSIEKYDTRRLRSWHATPYHNRECRTLKVTVFSPYQVLPDVIVSNTPHAVVVYYYYHNGWLARLAQFTGRRLYSMTVSHQRHKPFLVSRKTFQICWFCDQICEGFASN